MADVIFTNGTVLTMNPELPLAEALVVRGGRIAAVGSVQDVQSLNRPETQQVDLAGGCLMPGFHDSHVHLTQHGLELSRLKLDRTPSLGGALEQIGERAALQEVGSWLIGSGFSTSRWGVRTLGREELDPLTPEHPVYLSSQDHHSAWVNSRALEAAGIHRDTPDPPDGIIVRDESGEPTGLLLERAMTLVSRVLPQPSDEELRNALVRAGENLADLGITTVHHMDYEPTEYWRQLALAASQETFPVRVWACIAQEMLEHAAALGLATGQGGERFTIGGAKFFADGALGSLTAWMLEPYTGSDECGVAVHGPEVLAERLPMAIEAGLTPVIHAIGDAANRAVLDALTQTREAWRAKGLRPRIEHVQHLHPADLARFAELGVTASMQPYHMAFDAKRIRELLPERASGAYALRSLLDSGAQLAFGSDTPVADPDVRLGLLSACQREDEQGEVFYPQEALSTVEALAAYTRGAAWAIGRERRSGQLRPGFDADLVVLSDNPLEQLSGWQVQGTMVAGRWSKPLAQ